MSDGFRPEVLRYPDLFPRRLSGEPWGARTVVLDFLGGPYAMHGLAAWQVDVVRSTWGDLCREQTSDGGEDSEAVLRFELFRSATSDFVDLDLSGWTTTLDFSYEAERVCLASLHLLAVLELPNGRLERGGLWSAALDRDEFAGVFENFFRVALAYRLLALGGALLHSAGVLDRERAHLFVGHSGAGKSTISRLSLEGGREVLSDDLNAVLPADGTDRGAGFIVERLPFAGDLRRSESVRRRAPLAAVFSLAKQSDNVASTTSTARRFASLLGSAPFVASDPLRIGELERILLSLSAQSSAGVAFGHLGFHARDDSFWQTVRAFVDRSTRRADQAG